VTGCSPGNATPTTSAGDSVNSVIERRGRFSSRYRRAKRYARRVGLFLKSSLKYGGLFAVVLVTGMVVYELFQHQIAIDPIAVPRQLTDAGISPDVAAGRLRDALNELIAQAADAGGPKMSIAASGDLPEVVVPTVGLSTSTIASFLQRFFHLSLRTTIGGDVVWADHKVTITVRIDGEKIFSSREPVPLDHLDVLWQQAAEAVMLEISPYRVALARYENDPDGAVQLADSISGSYMQTDENTAWARMIRAARKMDFYQYGAAEKDFRYILQQAADATVVPFVSPPSYAQPAHFDLGVTLYYQGKSKAAVGEFRKAIALDPNDYASYHFLGLALQDLRRSAEAQNQFETVRAIYERTFGGSVDTNSRGLNSVLDHVSFGYFFMQENQTEEALAQFRWAVVLDPINDYALRSLCDALNTAKQYPEALQQCTRAVKLAPQHPPNQVQLSYVLANMNLFERARVAAEAALDADPDSPLVHEALGKVLEASRIDRTQNRLAYRAAVAAAINEYMAALNYAPSPLYHDDIGNALLREGNIAEAVAEFREARRLDPQEPWLLYELADALDKLGKTDDAVGEYKLAIALDPDNVNIRDDFGNFQYDHGNYVSAASAFGESIRLAPIDGKLYGELAEALGQQGKYHEGMRNLETAIYLDKSNARWRFDLGLFLRALNSSDPEALIALRKAMELDSTQSSYYYELEHTLDQWRGLAGSEPSRIGLGIEECRLLAEGLRLAPTDSDLQTEYASTVSGLPDPSVCSVRAPTAEQ
jgi:tetratricopeptide (TPR) repeat protein